MAKIKMKTKRAAAKRFRVTGKGKVKVGRKGKRHLFEGKSRKLLRNRKATILEGGQTKLSASCLTLKASV